MKRKNVHLYRCFRILIFDGLRIKGGNIAKK